MKNNRSYSIMQTEGDLSDKSLRIFGALRALDESIAEFWAAYEITWDFTVSKEEREVWLFEKLTRDSEVMWDVGDLTATFISVS